MKRRILSFALAMVLMFGLIPHMVIATNATTQADSVLNVARSWLGSSFYSGYCQAFVWRCFRDAGVVNASASSATVARGLWMIDTRRDNIPIGAAVYFTASSVHGHVGIYTGNGKMIHAVSTVREETISNFWWGHYQGWGWHGGRVLETPVSPPPVQPVEPDIHTIGENMTVNVGTGFTLRFCNTPASNNTSLGSIPNGAMVYVYGATLQQFPNNAGVNITWAKIRWNDRDGWVNYAWLENPSMITPQPSPTPTPTPPIENIIYPPAPYYSYGGGEVIEYNSKGEIIKVTYHDTMGTMVGWSEFQRATSHFSFIRTDHWVAFGDPYYTVNTLDRNGNIINVEWHSSFSVMNYNMTVNVGAGSTLRFCNAPTQNNTRIGSIPNGATVFVGGITTRQFPNDAGVNITWAKVRWNSMEGWVNYAWLR